MQNTWFQVPSIAVGATAWSTGDLPLVRARTVSVTVRLTYDTSASESAVCRIYYSPDGNHYDTVPLDEFAVNVTANSTVQETGLIAVPEHGYFKASIYNPDEEDALTDVAVWYSIQSWTPPEKTGYMVIDPKSPEYKRMLIRLGLTERGSILTDDVEDN